MTIKLSDLASVLKWGGVAGAAGCLLARYVEPAPRWDVLGCIGVSLAGLLLGGVAGWRERRAAGGGVPASGVPGEPVGFRASGNQRPERRERGQLGVLLVLLSVTLLIFGSASHVTPQLADARSGAARVDAVTVTEVRSSSSRPVRGGGISYTSKLTVTVDGPSKNALHGTIKTSGRVGNGDRLWALHNPQNSGGSGVDVQLSESEGELTALQSGTVRPGGALLTVVGGLAAAGLVLLLRRRFSTLDGSREAVAEALRTGNAQALAVTLDGTAAEGSRELGPALRLTAEDGERRLHLSRFVDVEHLAAALHGRTAWLYWERVSDQVPAGRPGRKGELLPAVLVLGEGSGTRYAAGWMPRAPQWPVAQGRRLHAVDPEASPLAEQLGADVLRRPRLRAGAVIWLGLALLATAAAMVFPIGGGEQFVLQTAVVVVVLCTVVGMRLTRARRRPSARSRLARTG